MRHDPHMVKPLVASRTSVFILLLAFVFALAMAIFPTYFSPPYPLGAHAHGGDWFIGTDTYMRLVRVRDWLAGGHWYADFSARSNWPYGEVLHWTRPMDVLLVALAGPFMAFVGVNRALYFSGVIVSPLLMLLAIWALVWGTQRILDVRGRVILVMLFAIQPTTRSYFSVARPDHHSLILLTFSAVLALLLRYATDPDATPRLAGWAGALSAFGIWISVESLSTELFALLALGVPWLITGHTRWLMALRRFTLAGVVMISLALVIERPPGTWLMSVTFDRLSIVHVALLVLIALGVDAMWRTHARFSATLSGRLGVSAAAAGLAAVVMYGLYPDFFKGPFAAAMDPRLKTIWLDKVQEFQPLLSDNPKTVVMATLILVPLAWLAVWMTKVRSAIKRDPAVQALAITLGLAAILYTALTLDEVRWGAYVGIIVVTPWALLLQWLLDWRGGPKIGPSPGTPLWRVPLITIVATGHLLGAIALSPGDLGAAPAKSPSCQWRAIAPYLNSAAFAGGKIQTIFSFIDQGPEILYRTPHRVVGAPYHRNARGILDTFAVLGGSDVNKAHEILTKRGVNYALFCIGTTEEKLFLKFPGETLMRKIVEGKAPVWLAPKPLPGDLGSSFRLYRVLK